jgi:hypothetical protein
MMGNLASGDGAQAKGLMGALGALLGGKSSFAMMGAETVSMGAQPDLRAAPPPATEAALAAAEARLGFALPPPLRMFETPAWNAVTRM